MNILQVHNKYKYTGGEWTVLNQEYGLLSREHSVGQYIVDNRKELRSPLKMLELPFRTHYNSSSKKKIYDVLKASDSPYDIMHVHNFFPLLTPSIFEAARQAGVPSVMTLHNFRLLHPNGFIFHDGKIDERGVKGSAYACVKDGVYRNSVLQTAVVAHMIEYHRRKKTWHRFPSLFIALTEFSKQKFVEGGIPGDRIVIKPNFMEDPFRRGGMEVKKEKEDVFLYVGRISREKGVEDLIDCWLETDVSSPLMIAGDGPEKQRLMKKTENHPSVHWLGFLDKTEILYRMANARALLFPTRWFEGFPLTLVEALSAGCPVITSGIGNPKKIITDGKTGLHFEPGNTRDLHQKIERMRSDDELRERLSINAREDYLKHYTPEINLKQMIRIYEMAAECENQLRSSTPKS